MSTEEQKVEGIGRVADNDRALLITMAAPPTDEELRLLHEYLRVWRAEIDMSSNVPDNAIKEHALTLKPGQTRAMLFYALGTIAALRTRLDLMRQP